jgi:hypothetical protein
LQGAAARWFQLYVSDDSNLDNTWEQLKTAFLQEWGETSTRRDAKKNLERRRQGRSEKTLEFYYELLYLYGQYDPDKVFDTFLEYFEDGLSEVAAEQYYYFTRPDRRPTEFGAVKKIARAIDEAPTRSERGRFSPQRGRFHSEDRETPEVPRDKGVSGYRQNGGRAEKPQYRERTREWSDQSPRYQERKREWVNQTPSYRERTQRVKQSPKREAYAGRPIRGRAQNYPLSSKGQDRQRRGSYSEKGGQGSKYPSRTVERTNIPSIRTKDNRPKCYACDRPGHYAASCPNGSGRQN